LRFRTGRFSLPTTDTNGPIYILEEQILDDSCKQFVGCDCDITFEIIGEVL